MRAFPFYGLFKVIVMRLHTIAVLLLLAFVLPPSSGLMN
jgi:hypothetical protein